MPDAQKIDIYFSVALWGEEFVRTFLDHCLPTQLAPQNLPAAAEKLSAVYRIFTTPEDIELFEDHWAVRRLHEVLPTEIIPVDIPAKLSIHEMVSDYHHVIVREARDKARWLIFLTPDLVWADGSFGNMAAILKEKDPDILVMATLRTDADRMMPEIERLVEANPESPIIIPPRRLVSLSISNLFSLSKLMILLFHTDWVFCTLTSSLRQEGSLSKTFPSQDLLMGYTSQVLDYTLLVFLSAPWSCSAGGYILVFSLLYRECS